MTIKKILFRPDGDNQEELDSAVANFPVITRRCYINNDDYIIGRYSVLPYYKELEEDIKYFGGMLVNSHQQHLWIANFFDYYSVLKEHTFETWKSNEMPYVDYDGPYVVKGATNSKKHQWNTLMFAENKRRAIEVGIELKSDMLLSSQDIIFRKFDPTLKVVEVGINGMRFLNEWRAFCFKDKVLTVGYYWTCAVDAENINNAGIGTKGLEFINKIAKIVANHVNFFVVDVAEREDGSWVVVELNDGQMSGLSMNDANTLYSNLYKAVNEEK